MGNPFFSFLKIKIKISLWKNGFFNFSINRMDPAFDLTAWKYLYLMSKDKTLDSIARENNISLTSLLRKIRAQEKCLGAHLLTQTRPLRLTEEALRNMTEIEKLLKAHQSLLNAFINSEPKRQTIQFAAAAGSLSAGEVNVVLMDFAKLYPSIEFQVEVGPKIKEVEEGKWEITTFTGELESPKIEKLSRGNAVYIPVASPSYLQKYGTPEEPSDLIHHFCAVFCGKSRKETTRLEKNGQTEHVFYQRCLKSTDILFLKNLVLEGEAIVVDLPLGHCAEEIVQGKLVPILGGWHRKSEPLWIVTSKEKWKELHIRIFMQWYSQTWREMLQLKFRQVLPYFDSRVYDSIFACI